MPFQLVWDDCPAQTGTNDKSPSHLRASVHVGCAFVGAGASTPPVPCEVGDPACDIPLHPARPDGLEMQIFSSKSDLLFTDLLTRRALQDEALVSARRRKSGPPLLPNLCFKQLQDI